MKKNQPLKSKMILFFAVLLSAFLTMQTTEVNASHFRGGSISWTQVSGNTVRFTVTSSWGSFVENPFLNFGDGTPSASVPHVLVSSGPGFVTYQGTITHTYATSGPYTAFWASCCRIGALQNASNANWRVETTVCLNGNTGSPVSSVPAIVQMVASGQSFQLPAADPDGDQLIWSWATTAQTGIPTNPPAGFTISPTGLLTLAGGVWSAGQQFALVANITEGAGGCGAKTVADFIVQIQAASSNLPPTCVLNGNATNNINVGVPFSISFTGTDPEGLFLTANPSSLPPGATISPLSGVSPLTTIFNYTPTQAQANQSFAITLTYVDAGNLTSLCSFSLTVGSGCQPAAFSACPANISVNNTAGQCNAAVTYTAPVTGNPAPGVSYTFTGATTGSGSGTGSGSTFNKGVTNVTINATNACGNVNCSFTVTVVDNEAPATPTLANVTSQCSATVTAPTTTDNCAGTVTGTTTTVFPITTQGTSTVTWTFTDPNGNRTTTQTQNIVVANTTAPTPDAPTLANATGQCSATITTAPTATGNCGNTITGTTNDALTRTTQGTSTVTWTFTDPNGNITTTQTQNMIVEDNTDPVIACPANTFVQYGNDESPATNGTATATDNCVSVSVGTPSDVTVNGPGNNKTITRTWTATDGANNTATCNQTITVCDLGVSLGNNRYVFFGIAGMPGASGVITATASGGLTGITYAWTATAGSFTVNGSGGSITPSGYTDAQAVTYTVTATAPNGCTATATVTITYFNINCSNNGNTVKVRVCHIPPGNPTNCNTICVSINAYQTLLNNGSYLGYCLPNCALPPTNFRGSEDIEDYIIKPAVKVKEEDKIKDELFAVTVLNNPTAGSFILKVSGIIKDKISIRIMDMNGMLVEQQTNLYAGQEIQIGNRYVSGTYFAEITQGANRQVVKLVKLN